MCLDQSDCDLDHKWVSLDDIAGQLEWFIVFYTQYSDLLSSEHHTLGLVIEANGLNKD